MVGFTNANVAIVHVQQNPAVGSVRRADRFNLGNFHYLLLKMGVFWYLGSISGSRLLESVMR